MAPGRNKHASGVADHAGFLDGRADHEAGRVAQAHDGQIEGVAELHEARALVAGLYVEGAAEMGWVVGDETHRPALYAHERGDHAVAPVAPKLEHGVVVRERFDHAANVVNAQAILGNEMAQAAWSVQVQSAVGPWK